ncbi:MAG: hypothetical protein JNM22_16815 [Saprospiraceae bacterium]|nr:hypothetical protein [Saprospiraceae bacterium]
MKIFLTGLLSAVCLFASLTASAQYADAIAPRPASPGKFIFYWGQQQCDLTAEQQYTSRMRLTAPEFRQMLLSTPKLWNGAGLVPDFSFYLQQVQVQTKDYLTQIAALDQQFVQVATAGQTLNITRLPLGNGLEAHIDIDIIAPKSENLVYGYQGYAPFLNNRSLQTVVWGQEDKFECSRRDFFTVSELWQIFGQEPYIEWNPWVEPHSLLAEFQIIDDEAVTMALRFELDKLPYSDFVHQARVFQHLVKPGVRVTLLLQTADEYENLFQKSMQLVPDGDERLHLRRDRDFHTLEFRWNDWFEKIEYLYLSAYPGADGNPAPVDGLIIRRSFLRSRVDSVASWAQTPPSLLLDEEVLAGASYTIHLGDSQQYRVENGLFEPEKFLAAFSTDTLRQRAWRITDIVVPGFTVPTIQITTFQNFRTRNALMALNTLNDLRINATTIPHYNIQAPVKEGGQWKFKVEAPGNVDLIFSVFGPNGLGQHVEDTIVKTGDNTFSVPVNALYENGKYLAFLNSVYGVAKVEFEIP